MSFARSCRVAATATLTNGKISRIAAICAWGDADLVTAERLVIFNEFALETVNSNVQALIGNGTTDNLIFQPLSSLVEMMELLSAPRLLRFLLCYHPRLSSFAIRRLIFSCRSHFFLWSMFGHYFWLKFGLPSRETLEDVLIREFHAVAEDFAEEALWLLRRRSPRRWISGYISGPRRRGIPLRSWRPMRFGIWPAVL